MAKMSKQVVVAATFINRKGQNQSKPPLKPRTSTLDVPQPRPQPKPAPQVNQIRQTSPTCLWVLSNTEMS